MVKFLLKLNFWVIFFTLIAYITPFVSPHTMSFLIYVGLAYPWLLVLNLIFIVLWSVSRYRYWWYSAVCVVMGWNYLTTIFGFSFFQDKKPKVDLKVMTYNLGYLPISSKKLIRLNEFIENQNCDIICLQEFCNSDNNLKIQAERVSPLSKFPYKVHGDHSLNAIFSKYPITNSGVLRFETQNQTNGCLYVDLQIQDKTIRCYDVHLQSNKVTGLMDELEEQGVYERQATWLKLYTLLKRIRLAAQLRAKQAELIANHIAQSQYPLIVCGDFNDIPVSYSYSVVSKNLKDAFKESGRGFAKTYAGNIPALKIDFIFTDKSIKSHNTEILKVYFSDHFPTISYLSL